MRGFVLSTALLFAMASPVLAQAPTNCNRHAQTNVTPQITAARRMMNRACAPDRVSLCQDVPKGCGGPMRCLKSHYAQLSPSCTGAMRNLQALRANPQ